MSLPEEQAAAFESLAEIARNLASTYGEGFVAAAAYLATSARLMRERAESADDLLRRVRRVDAYDDVDIDTSPERPSVRPPK